MRMSQVPGIGKRNGLELYDLSQRVNAIIRDVGPGQAMKEIIGAAVLLHDDDYVLNRRHREHRRIRDGSRTCRYRGLSDPLAHRQPRSVDGGHF